MPPLLTHSPSCLYLALVTDPTPTDQFPSKVYRFNSATAKAAAARSNATQAARRAAIANAARLAAIQPELLASELAIACAETLQMLRNTNDPRDRAYLAKTLRDLKAAAQLGAKAAGTTPNSKPVLPPPRPVMPAGHRAAEPATTVGNGLQPAPQPPEPIEREQPRPEADDEGQGHPATW